MQANRNLWNELRNHHRLADLVVDAIAAAGARHVFAMPAESLNPLIDAIRKSDRIRLITVRHEGVGALMASAEAKLTGRLGVCMGTTGPGATHLVIGAADAREDRAPVLFLTGTVPIHQVGSGGFQEVDSIKLFDGSVAFNRLVASPRQAALVPLAIAHARAARAGVHLAFPSDVLTDRVDELPSADPASIGGELTGDAPHDVWESWVVSAANRLLGARRPAIVVGAADHQSRLAIEDLASGLQAPVFFLAESMAVMASGGDVARPALRCGGDPRVDALLARADTVVLVGPASSALLRCAVGRPAVHLVPDGDRGGPTHHAARRVTCELAATIRALAVMTIPGEAAWRAEADWLADDAAGAAVPAAWQAVDRALPDDAIVSIEPGLIAGAFAHLPPRRRRFTSSFGASTPGYGLAGAIAACLSYPRHPVYALVDRLGLAIAMPELMTARKYDLPLRAICFDSGGPVKLAELAGSMGAACRRAPAASAEANGAPRQLAIAVPSAALRDTQAELLIVDDTSAVAAAGKNKGACPTSPAASTAASAAASADPPISRRAARIASLIAECGVSHVFGAPSPSLASLIAAIEAEPQLTFVAAEQPESAAMMASGYGKWTQRPSVCCVDEAHLAFQLNGIYDAAFDSAPVVMLTAGGSPGALHLLADATSSRAIAGPDQLPAAVIAAIADARGTRGVSHVAMTVDALVDAPVDSKASAAVVLHQDDVQMRAAWNACFTYPDIVWPSRDAIDAAAELLRTASRPVLLLGRGAIHADNVIDQLARLLPAVVVSSMPGRAALPWSHPHHAGGIGASGHASAIDAVAGCDVLVSLGCSNRGAIFGLVGEFTQIQVDRDPRQMGRRKQTSLSIVGDVRPTVEALIERLTQRPSANGQSHQPARRQFVEDRRAAFTAWQAGGARRLNILPRKRIHPAAICHAIDAALAGRRQRAVLTVDIGVTTLWAYRYFLADHDIVWSSSFATMGIAVPSALAIQLAEPNRPVIALVGDGGIAVTMAELATAARRKLPIIAIVFNNGKLAAIKYEQEVMGWPEYESRLVNCDFARLAHAHGLRGLRVETEAALAPALTSALDARQPCVIDVICDPHAMPAPPRIHPWQAAGYLVAISREAGLFASGFMRRQLRQLQKIIDGNRA